jgi:hypothetical protein
LPFNATGSHRGDCRVSSEGLAGEDAPFAGVIRFVTPY